MSIASSVKELFLWKYYLDMKVFYAFSTINDEIIMGLIDFFPIHNAVIPC
jgi:hypothetical protein